MGEFYYYYHSSSWLQGLTRLKRGGKSESRLSRPGYPHKEAEDQDATDKSVRALLSNFKKKQALVLLVDDKYALFPYGLAASKYTYVVLGFFWISHAWGEYLFLC